MKPSIYLLDHFGFIKISGKDAMHFLQGQLTADINTITPSHSSLCARCTPQGRVVSVFRIFQYQEAYFLRLPLSMVQTTIESLKKFAIFSKVIIEDKSSEWVAIGIAYPNEDLDTLAGYITSVPGEERFEYYIPKNQHHSIWEKLEINADVLSHKKWHALNLVLGIPEIYPQTSERYTPHDLNLPKLNAVSFEKGCYAGQEIIARMHYRGTLKQHLYCCETSTLPTYNEAIQQANNPVGRVIDFEETDNNKVIFIALVRDEAVHHALNIQQKNIIFL